MTCAEFQAEASLLLDNEIPDDRQVATFSHLASCAACREFFRSSRFIRRHLEELPPYPPGLDTRIREATHQHRHAADSRMSRSHRSAAFARSIRIPLPAAAAVLLALGTSIFFAVDAATSTQTREEQVIYVPTLPEVEVEAAIAQTTPNTR